MCVGHDFVIRHRMSERHRRVARIGRFWRRIKAIRLVGESRVMLHLDVFLGMRVLVLLVLLMGEVHRVGMSWGG